MFDQIQSGEGPPPDDTPAVTAEPAVSVVATEPTIDPPLVAPDVPVDPWAMELAAAEAELVAASASEALAYGAATAAQAALSAASRRRYDAERALAQLRQRRAAAMAGAP